MQLLDCANFFEYFLEDLISKERQLPNGGAFAYDIVLTNKRMVDPVTTLSS